MALTTINSGGVKDDSIVNADIKSDAAIAGSKVAPDFGSQNIITTGNVGIGTGSGTSTPLHIVGSDNTTTLLVESTDADANVGPIIELFRNSGSPADNDAIGRIDFKCDDDAGNASTFARIAVTALDVSNGSEDARIDFISATNDTFTPTMSISGGNVGIGTTSPSRSLHVSNNGSDGTQLQLTGTLDSAGIKFVPASGDVFEYQAVATGCYVAYNRTDSRGDIFVDGTGNVGIGTASTKTWSLGKALHIGVAENALWGEADYAFHIMQNAYYNSGWKYTHTDEATIYSQEDGTHRFKVAASGTANAAITWKDAFRIDSSGRLQIGSSTNTSYNDFDGVGRLSLQNNSADGTLDFTQGIVFTDNASDEGTWTHAGIVTTGSTGYNGNLVFGTDGNDTRDQTGITERLRITSGGDIQFHRTAYEAGTVEQKINYYSDAGTAGSAVMGKNCEIALVKKDSWDTTWTSYGEIVFRTNGDSRYALDEAARFNRSGNLAFPNGQGIDFSASESSNTISSSILADYEEGSWTPADASGAGLSFGSVHGYYTKIGNIVHANGSVTFPTTSDTTSFLITLPFQATNNGGGYTSGSGSVRYTSKAQVFTIHVRNNVSNFSAYTFGGTGMRNNDMSTDRLDFCCTYPV